MSLRLVPRPVKTAGEGADAGEAGWSVVLVEDVVMSSRKHLDAYTDTLTNDLTKTLTKGLTHPR